MTQTRHCPPTRKILLYSHDTFGLGHLRRNLAIASHLLTRHPGRHVVLVSGSTVSDHFARPHGLTIVKLPPVVKIGAEQYQALDRRLTMSLIRRVRSAIISDVVRRLRPDVFLVDHSPAGMGGELLPVFDEISRSTPRTRVALGLRDILDEPGTVRALWSEQGIYELLDQVYDECYVYGSEDVFDVVDAYGLPAEVRKRLVYCGYLDKPFDRPIERFPIPEITDPYVLATAGGGGDGVQVLEAAIDAAARIGMRSLIVTGPLMDECDVGRLDLRAASNPGAQIVKFHPDIRSAMTSASAIVTMGGYNSLCESVASGTPTVTVPRVAPRQEQAIRAELFARRGLVDVVLPGPGLPGRLATAIAASVAGTLRARRELDFGGLEELDRALSWPDARGQDVPAMAGALVRTA
jgi:predicted glycosyltransferase